MAKILTSVSNEIRNITKNEPSIALTPTTNGVAEATNPPKIKSKSKNVSGIAIASDFAKSLLI